jgi:hypothetical protein
VDVAGAAVLALLPTRRARVLVLAVLANMVRWAAGKKMKKIDDLISTHYWHANNTKMFLSLNLTPQK